jgi:hypothetical protein
MKLAEALILRADCQKRVAQLKSRLLVNAKVQEGDAPAETPQELIAELGRVSSDLLDLIKRINRRNSATWRSVMCLRFSVLLTPTWRRRPRLPAYSLIPFIGTPVNARFVKQV